jgi:superfamily I DNA/RNA helicase
LTDQLHEQLAMNLGDGHRVIHGVAGSGKTFVLISRAEHLAKACTATSRPILVICRSEPLAVKLASIFHAKGIDDRVHALHFHRWCRQQLVEFGQPVPQQSWQMFDQMVDNVLQAFDRREIPSGQYQAVLIDEAEDFPPEWLRLVAQMVDPTTNSLLLMYDDAQGSCKPRFSRPFSFKSVGIQAQGRTSILRINRRNTKQILQTANLIAADALKPVDQDDDGVPLIQPISSGREGPPPQVIRLASIQGEAKKIVELLACAHQDGVAWGEMAIIGREYSVIDVCVKALRRSKLPYQVRKGAGHFKPERDVIRVLTMKACKGLEFSVVALPGIGRMPLASEEDVNEAQLFYVAATRATQRLFITVSGGGQFGALLGV